MPSTVSLIMKTAASMLPLSAAIQASRFQSRKFPAGGPPELLTMMSGSGHALSAAARPSSVVMSIATGVTLTPVAALISSAAASMLAAVRATMVTSTPSRASDIAHALPKPALAPPMMAFLPAIPKFMLLPPSF